MKSYSKILVTGGAGFIGSHLVDGLLSKGLDVTVLDDFSYGKTENISSHKNVPEFHLVRGDVRDVGSVKEAVEDVDAVFHEAALVGVSLSVENPLLFNDVNVVGTINLLTACRDFGVKRFIFASSAAVYGDSESVKKKENMILKPVSPYGVSKLAAENYVRLFCELYGLETVCLRYFNVYGPRQAFTSNYTGVIIAFADRLLRGEAPIIHGDGKQTRDFVHVADVVSANMSALETKNAVGKVLNVASGTATGIYELARMLQQVTNKEHLKPVFAERRDGDVRHCIGDTSRARRLLGFRTEIGLQEGLSELIKWYSHVDAKTGQVD